MAKKALDDLLAKNGITDPAGTLKNIRAASLPTGVASPELANDVRHGMASCRKPGASLWPRSMDGLTQTLIA